MSETTTQYTRVARYDDIFGGTKKHLRQVTQFDLSTTEEWMDDQVEDVREYIQRHFLDPVLVSLATFTNQSVSLDLANDHREAMQQALTKIAFQLDMKDEAPKMFAMHQRFLQDYVTETVLGNLGGLTGYDLYEKLVREWKAFTMLATLLNELFEYVDRTYRRHNGLLTMGQLCQKLFKEQVMERAEIKTAFRDSLMDQIRRDRDEERIDKGLIKDAIQIYIDLSRVGDSQPIRVNASSESQAFRFGWSGTEDPSYYESCFEQEFLRLAQVQYQTKAEEWIGKFNCVDYLTTAKICLKTVRKNGNDWLAKQTKDKIMEIVIGEVVTKKAQQAADGGYFGQESNVVI